MSTFSSDGEVFGAKVIYGAVVALSAVLLYAALTPVHPRSVPYPVVTADAPQVETVVVADRSAPMPY